MTAVADASVLIWLAKVGRLYLLEQQYGSILIPSEVYSEVVEEGLKEGYADALVVRDAFEKGWIKVEAAPTEQTGRIMRGLPELHEGEAAAMSLAIDRRAPLLIDESSGRVIATALGLRPRGAIHVLFKAAYNGSLSTVEARDTISSMVSAGFRIEPKLLERVLRELSDHVPRKRLSNP